MFQILTCNECHSSKKGLPFSVTWRYETKHCDYCKESKDEFMSYNFCSDKCLVKFFNRFNGHNHKWVPMFPTYGVQNKEGKYNAYYSCKICHITKWREISEKDAKRYEREAEKYFNKFEPKKK